MIKIKRPLRDACLYSGEREQNAGPPAPPAPAFSIAYSSATNGWILFKFNTFLQ